ncbi:MAG: hypothetical protein H7839_21425 [Magnetococcus sp. YQC-5]
MINSLQNTTIFGISNHLQDRAALQSAVHDIRTANGQELEAYHIQQVSANDGSGYMPSASLGGQAQALGSEDLSYESIARRIEAARIAAEESAQEQEGSRTKSNTFDSDQPLDQTLAKEARLARTAHQVVARYLMTVQGYDLGDPAIHIAPVWRA